jgi:hypothetical protein
MPKKTDAGVEKANARRSRSSNSKEVSARKTSRKKGKTTDAQAQLNLAALAEGMPGLTPASARTLAEAAAVCLESQKHQPLVQLGHAGLTPKELRLVWPTVDDQQRRTYADMQEATELGACGVAILVVKEATAKVVVERSKKGTGFDYWLGDTSDDNGLPFAGASRLEVSGILTGTKSQIQSRIKQKKGQLAPSDHLAPGFVAVVEFGTPIACVENK